MRHRSWMRPPLVFAVTFSNAWQNKVPTLRVFCFRPSSKGKEARAVLNIPSRKRETDTLRRAENYDKHVKECKKETKPNVLVKGAKGTSEKQPRAVDTKGHGTCVSTCF